MVHKLARLEPRQIFEFYHKIKEIINYGKKLASEEDI
jgi:hypothetical protein